VFAIGSAGVVAFQIALAAGAPWGAYAMGGAVQGQFSPTLRVAALVQATIIALTVAIVLSRAGLVLPRWSRAARWLVWVVVAGAVVSAVLNVITPSSGERAIWAPVALVLLASSLTVALGARSAARR
jgi:hypothetical protein